jgi:hypothetical protein
MLSMLNLAHWRSPSWTRTSGVRVVGMCTRVAGLTASNWGRDEWLRMVSGGCTRVGLQSVMELHTDLDRGADGG